MVAVGPGHAGAMLVAGGLVLNPLPIQPAKIHCPPERSDTLSRERLNSWLERAAAGRLGLIVAEAGYGKTTLLGDWARHTRRRTLWYRLESDDRDWLTFVRHLVASGRELDPEFAPTTYALLLALGTGGPTQKDLVASIAQELADLASTSDRGLTLILDDYHLVDGFKETDAIVRALLDRTGQSFSLVIASRSTPTLALGRLRARGGVMNLSGRELCFDEAETSSLFRDAFHHPLDDDVASELWERTEGWAALLALASVRLADHEDPRNFVANLRATAGDTYDYLAEELFSSLSADIAEFAMRCSILVEVEPQSAALVAGGSVEDAATLILEAERLGLMLRPDRGSLHRFHPLVKEFLLSRLATEIGAQAMQALNRAVADDLPPAQWHRRAWHLLQAGDTSACAAAVDQALEQILASGDFERARQFLGPGAGNPHRAGALLLRSKLELVRGNYHQALHLARRAVSAGDGGALHGLCLLNLAATLGMAGIADEAEAISRQALGCDLSDSHRWVVQANLALMSASQEGDLLQIDDELRTLADHQESAGFRRYAAISRLNRAGVLLWLGDSAAALVQGSRAEVLLGGLASQSIERVSATAITGVALAQLGRYDDGVERLRHTGGLGSLLTTAEIALETTRLELEFGSVERASAALSRFDPTQHSRGYLGLYYLLAGELALREGRLGDAQGYLDRLVVDRCADAAGKLRAQLLRCRICLCADPATALMDCDEALRIATAQQSPRGIYAAYLLSALARREDLDAVVLRCEESQTYVWTTLASEMAEALDLLSPMALERVVSEAELRPDTWRSALRQSIEKGGSASVRASSLLAIIGIRSDAAWLREEAASHRQLRPAAVAITTRLAEPIHIHDLGPVEVAIGEAGLSKPLRKKVLALLCYLASRPRMAANREEAAEALWPDLSSNAASNSLHQAIYFMRRVFEPDFREGMSANYIRVDGDIVSLNQDLVHSLSQDCWELLGDIRQGHLEVVPRLVEMYAGRYAQTFAYDEWAEAYRENLHAAVLAAAERAMTHFRKVSEFDAAIRIGHRILGVDPHADAVELELLRAYKYAGHRAAAAEQYAHYAAYVRGELAAEPPSWEDI